MQFRPREVLHYIEGSVTGERIQLLNHDAQNLKNRTVFLVHCADKFTSSECSIKILPEQELLLSYQSRGSHKGTLK